MTTKTTINKVNDLTRGCLNKLYFKSDKLNDLLTRNFQEVKLILKAGKYSGER